MNTPFSYDVSEKPHDEAFLTEVGQMTKSLATETRILDLGCGEHCQAARLFHHLGIAVVAVDSSEHACAQAKQVCLGLPIVICRCDIRNLQPLDLEAESFHGVSLFYTTQHIAERAIRPLLTALLYLLVPDGVLAIAALTDAAVPEPSTRTFDDNCIAEPPPLNAVLKSMYASFLSLQGLSRIMMEIGMRDIHTSCRSTLYANEFPCQRCYVTGRK